MTGFWRLKINLRMLFVKIFKKIGIVVPAWLRRGLLTVGALDNLDYNPSSTTALGSFHGTGISLFSVSNIV